ncbi:MAG: DUF4340 domain-containing protein, partial [Clostridia bacterium]|nr:DUF4340 domain-containing protein [Clostridia bacterium]
MINKSNRPASPSDNTGRVLRPAIIKGSVPVILLIALVVTYILLPAELKGQGSVTENSSSEIHLLDGEVAAGTTSIYLFPPLSSSDLSSIIVENTNCSFKLTRSGENGFYLDDNEQISYSDSAFATLMVATCNTITNERVYPDLKTGEGPEIINYPSFGLSEDTMSGKYTLNTLDGETYTVRIGNPVPSGTGYYACLEGREAVYILGTDLQTTVLGTVESIVTPTLGIQNYDDTDSDSAASSGSIDHFSLWNGSEHVATIHSVGTDDKVLINSMYNFAMSCKQSITSSQLLACKDKTELESIIGTSAIQYAYVPETDTYNAVSSLLPTLTGDETVAIKD